MAGFPYHTGDSGLWTSHRFGAFRGRIGALSGPGVAELVPPAGALTTDRSRPMADATPAVPDGQPSTPIDHRLAVAR